MRNFVNVSFVNNSISSNSIMSFVSHGLNMNLLMDTRITCLLKLDN